jgi:hypothetical protein
MRKGFLHELKGRQMLKKWLALGRILGGIACSSLIAMECAVAGIVHDGGFQYKGDIPPERTAILDTYKDLAVEDEGVFSGTLHLAVREKVLIAQGTGSIPVFNVWGAIIKVPQPIALDKQLVDLFWIFGAGRGADAGPLPTGSYLESASVFGLNGTEYVATVSSINNLADLPTVSAHDLSVTWNLDGLAYTTGNFYLVNTSLPFSAVTIVPEAGATWLLLAGLSAVLFMRALRRRSSVAQATVLFRAVAMVSAGLAFSASGHAETPVPPQLSLAGWVQVPTPWLFGPNPDWPRDEPGDTTGTNPLYAAWTLLPTDPRRLRLSSTTETKTLAITSGIPPTSSFVTGILSVTATYWIGDDTNLHYNTFYVFESSDGTKTKLINEVFHGMYQTTGLAQAQELFADLSNYSVNTALDDWRHVPLVPEPGTTAIFLSGLLCVVLLRKRSRPPAQTMPLIKASLPRMRSSATQASVAGAAGSSCCPVKLK